MSRMTHSLGIPLYSAPVNLYLTRNLDLHTDCQGEGLDEYQVGLRRILAISPRGIIRNIRAGKAQLSKFAVGCLLRIRLTWRTIYESM